MNVGKFLSLIDQNVDEVKAPDSVRYNDALLVFFFFESGNVDPYF